MADALLDTGAILAALDKRDPWHSACGEALRDFRFPLITSEAVLTELFHLIGNTRVNLETTWRFVLSGVLKVAEMDHSELASIQRLMVRYRDRPMDFADATLVYLAERESLSTIVTVDHADFETYRIRGVSRFRIVPSRNRR